MLMVVVNGRQQMVGFAGLLMETIAGMAFPGQSPSTMVVEWKYGPGGGQMAAGQFMQPIMGMEFVVTDTGGAPPMAAPPAASPAASYASHAAPAASGWSPFGSPPPPPTIPAQPVAKLGSPGDRIPTTVDEAWELFGIKRKRATKAEVKKIYRALQAKWHPDRHMRRGAKERKMAELQSSRANLAWTILERHCKW